MKRSALLAILVLAAFPLSATNGYFAHGQGPAAKAMGGAGIALPQDPLAATTNPAAIAFVDPGMIVELALFNPNRGYTITGMPSGMQGTFGLAPGTVDSKSELFVMPSLAANWRPSERLAFALSAVAQGGMNTDYRQNTFWGGDHTGVDLAQMFLDTSLAWKLTPNQSIGATVRAVYQQFEAQGLQAFATFSGAPAALTNNEHDISYGVGFEVGYYAKIHPDFAIAAAYSPKTSMSKLDDYSGLFCNLGEFDIPANATIGLAWDLTERLTWVADVEQIEYSGVNAVGHHLFPNLLTAPLGTHGGPGFGWDDVTAYKTGIQYAASPNWTLRAGYSTANQPIPASEVFFNILAPGVIEDHITAGFSRALPGGGAFHFSLMHALRNSVAGPNPLEVPGQQTIELTMDEWEAEFGWSIRF